MILYLVISGCALVQSLFGIGILFFGTPTLLILGYSFEQALWYLLPCSIMVSAIQVVAGRRHIADFWKAVMQYCLPGLLGGTLLVLYGGVIYNVRPYIGAMMVLTAVLRCLPLATVKLSALLARYAKPSLTLIGFIHGATNMGGVLLTMLVSALYARKEEMRGNVACGYLLMAVWQFLCLAMVRGTSGTDSHTVLLPMAALLIYAALGNRLFHISPQRLYQRLLTTMIFLFGAHLLWVP